MFANIVMVNDMKSELLINDVIKKLNGLILDFNVYCTMNNIDEVPKTFDM